jgi:hypothetical protein
MFRKFFILFLLFLNFFCFNKSYSCEIVQFGSGDRDLYISGYFVGPDCTAEDLSNYLKTLPTEEKKNNYRNFITAVMGNKIESSQMFSNLTNFLSHILPHFLSPNSPIPSLNSTVVAFDTNHGQGGDYNPEQFQKEFNTSYNKQNLGQYIAAGALGTISNNIGIAPTTSAEISKSVLAGYVVANFIQSGMLQNVVTDIGNTLALGFHTVVFGAHEPDYIADATIRAEQNAINQMYDNYRKALVDWEYHLDSRSYNLSVLSDMKWHAINQNIAKSGDAISELMNQMRADRDSFDTTLAKVTSMAKTAEADLHKSEEEIKNLRQRLLPDQAVQKMKDNYTSKLNSADASNPFNGLDEISSDLQTAYLTTNPLFAAQMKNILKDYIDDNGILISLSANEKKLYGYHFKTDLNAEDNLNAGLIRDAINESLALKHFATNQNDYERGDIALSLALAADQAYGKGNNSWGNRYSESSLEISSYAGHDSNREYFTRTQLSDSAKSDYGINISADTFEHYKLIELANKLSKNQNIQANPYLKLYANSLVQQAYLDSNGDSLNSFMSSINNGLLFLDSVASGMGSGVTQYVTDTATGISHLVTHPVDSAAAMFNAVSNYHRTWDIVKNNTLSVMQNFPNFTVEEKAQFITKTSLDIASLLLPVGDVANIANRTGDFSKFADSLNAVTNTLVNYAYEGIAGLEKADGIAPGYLKYLDQKKGDFGYGSALELGNNLSSATPEFIVDLMNYGQKNNLELKEITAISRFKDGGSVFLSEQAYGDYIVNGSSPVLGANGELFLTSRDAAFEIINNKYSKNQIEEILGLTKNALKTGVVKYEIPFSFSFNPRLPTKATSGANEFFIPGGFTSGHAPELIFYNVSKMDMQNILHLNFN